MLCILLTSVSYAGTYSLKLGARVDSTLDGKILPSCELVLEAIRKRYVVTKVVHDGKRGAVAVNDEEWKLVGGLAQIERIEPVNYRLILKFSHQKSLAYGSLFVIGISSDRTPICHDAFELAGNYHPK